MAVQQIHHEGHKPLALLHRGGRSARRTFCPPDCLPEGARRLCVRRGLFSPSLAGGLPLLLLFRPRLSRGTQTPFKRRDADRL